MTKLPKWLETMILVGRTFSLLCATVSVLVALTTDSILFMLLGIYFLIMYASYKE